MTPTEDSSPGTAPDTAPDTPPATSATHPVVCILAAGRGSRLGSLTDALPKSLLQVAGRSILSRQLDALAAAGIPGRDIRVVSGHAVEALEREHPDVARIHNPLWDVHNNVYSVHLLAGHVPDDLLLINGDTLFHPQILTTLLSTDGDALLTIDDTCALAEEQMKVVYADGRLRRIGKDLDPAASHGEYIGMLRFRGAALAAYYRSLARMIDAGQTDDWYEGALNGIVDEVVIGKCSTGGRPWTEVDTPEDLAEAGRIAAGFDAAAVAGGANSAGSAGAAPTCGNAG